MSARVLVVYVFHNILLQRWMRCLILWTMENFFWQLKILMTSFQICVSLCKLVYARRIVQQETAVDDLLLFVIEAAHDSFIHTQSHKTPVMFPSHGKIHDTNFQLFPGDLLLAHPSVAHVEDVYLPKKNLSRFSSNNMNRSTRAQPRRTPTVKNWCCFSLPVFTTVMLPAAGFMCVCGSLVTHFASAGRDQT